MMSWRMETYDNQSWCSYSNQSEDDEDEDREGQSRRHHLHLAKARSRSSSRSRRRSSFLVDELDMLMDQAATTLQAAWRGHLTRQRLAAENTAAATIQAAWRRFLAREYPTLQREWTPYRPPRHGHRQWTPSPATFRGEGRARRWARMDDDQAAEVIQAHYRRYVTRRAFVETRQAAVTIQAHWRGYRVRQEMDLRTRPSGPARSPRAAGYGYRPGPSAWVGPYPRKHWRKCLVGDPEEWASVLTPGQHRPRERERRTPDRTKRCPDCGRCTNVRVLVGVGKGRTSESEMEEESEGEGHVLRSPSRRRPKPREAQDRLRQHPDRGHVSCKVHGKARYSSPWQVGTEDQPRRPGGRPGDPGLHYAAATTAHTSVRFTRERTTVRSLSSTSLQPPGPFSPGGTDWLYESFGARRVGEGQKRVFKTRKQVWQIARAATLIQSFWRGWKVRQALRLQQEAATKIQSAYRGYKTRMYLIEVGVLSEGDTE
ncbi:uncharacterized protein LOC110091277 [Pogona vitticeps]